jgi:hypothetical protein
MTYMRSWKSHRLTSYTRLSLNPQNFIGRPLSRIVGAIGFFFVTWSEDPKIYHKKLCFQSQTQWWEKLRKTEIQVGEWDEQR